MKHNLILGQNMQCSKSPPLLPPTPRTVAILKYVSRMSWLSPENNLLHNNGNNRILPSPNDELHIFVRSWQTAVSVPVRQSYETCSKLSTAKDARFLWWYLYSQTLVASLSNTSGFIFREFLKRVSEDMKHNIQVCISTINGETLNRVESNTDKWKSHS